MTLAYFDCFSGISGDMTLGALVDAGVSIDVLRSELKKLGLPGYELRAEKVKRAGIAATKVHVIIEKKDRERHLADITAIINGSSLSAPIKERSIGIFNRLAEAEARVHGTTSEKIHFHEVGAVDAIVDIVGSVIGLDRLGVTRVRASAVNVGSGTVQTSHGLLPVPAPATAELLKGIPFYQSEIKFELATPTGAAIVSTVGTSFGPLPEMKVDRIAYGAGDGDFPERPNVLRLMIGEPAAACDEDSSMLIETNIDDMNPQVYDYLVDKLMQLGAQDAYLTPIIMKKGRPAVLLSVLTDKSRIDDVLAAVFRETTSIGVRIREVGRRKLSREIREVETLYGKIRIKVSKRGDDILTATPEYEDCRRIAEERKVPLKIILEEAKACFLAKTQRTQRESENLGDV
jgi:pyridinium-3,5-bisthiocarboxylic acid mononucleotide nickel chelatase